MQHSPALKIMGKQNCNSCKLSPMKHAFSLFSYGENSISFPSMPLSSGASHPTVRKIFQRWAKMMKNIHSFMEKNPFIYHCHVHVHFPLNVKDDLVL